MLPTLIPFRGEERRTEEASWRWRLYNKTPPVFFRHQVNGGEHCMSEAIVDEKSNTGREELWSEVTDGSLRSRGRDTQECN